MAMVSVDDSSLLADSQPKLVDLVWVSAALALFYIHSEPGELSQWLYHDDSIINIVLSIHVIIIMPVSVMNDSYYVQHILSHGAWSQPKVAQKFAKVPQILKLSWL